MSTQRVSGFGERTLDRGAAVLHAIRERIEAYESGQAGASVRAIDLTVMPARRLYTALVARAFVHRRCPFVAHRGRRGEPYYLRGDGTSTVDPNDPTIVPVDVYVHADGGFVRVFPAGDPPTAYAGVLLVAPSPREDPFTGQVTLDFDASPSNEACRISARGHAVPRGPRQVHGLRYDPANKLESLLFAREVMERAKRTLPVLAVEAAS
jgi:hypothetical protein